MKLTIYFLIFGGGLFFIFYLRALVSLHGLDGILFTLLDTRAIMRDEGALPGFHFFYFWEMLLPLTVFYVLLFGKKKDFILVAVILVLTASIILTAAKTNIFKALVWSFIVYSLLKYEDVKFHSIIFIASCAISFGFLLFSIHTGLTGALPEFSDQSSDALARFSAQFPTFHLLINDTSISHSYGKMIFLPLMQLAHVFLPDLQVPSYILDFYSVPFLFNLATYLDVFYKDFGIVGVLILPWLFGIVSAGIFYIFSFNKKSFFVIFAMSIILCWTTESPNVSGFIKASYWFQIIFGYVAYRFIWVKKRSDPVPHVSISRVSS
jgi:oligosaccharide repeat unit polymerase